MSEKELINAFNKFSVWILFRRCTPSAVISLLHGKIVHSELHNYMIALQNDEKCDSPSLTIMEHYLTKAEFESVPEKSRSSAKERIIKYLNISHSCSVDHFVHVANDWPAVVLKAPGIRLLANAELHSFDVSSIPEDALYKISISRELPDARNRNVYDVVLRNGQTVREIMRMKPALKPATHVPLQKNTHYYVDARAVNGIRLEDLSNELHANGGHGVLFLVRQATLEDIVRYVKKKCVDRLEDVRSDTRFLVSETVPFDGPFQLHATVHEVAYLEDYGIVFWLRTKGSPCSIGKYFTFPCWNQYDSIPPSPSWLNVLVSNETDGSSTYLRKLAASAKKIDPFRMVKAVEATDMIKVLRKPNITLNESLNSLFDAQTEHERLMVESRHPLLLIDHAMADNGSDEISVELVKFLNLINGDPPAITVWIVGDDGLWSRLASDCRHVPIKYNMPVLNEDQRKECLRRMLAAGSPPVEKVIEQMVANNSRKERGAIFGNLFFLAVVAESVNDCIKVADTPSYWWMEAMERFIWKHIAPANSRDIKELEEQCYNNTFLSSANNTSADLPIYSRFNHRTLRKLLTARYLAQHPDKIDLAKYRCLGKDLIDYLLFRHSPVAIAVLHHDVETVRQSQQNAPEELRSISDCLQRNLLHIVHDCVEIEDLLLSAHVSFEQECSQWSNWTPMHAAMDRDDWSFVDRMLTKGASLQSKAYELHTMTVSELEDVFCDCIASCNIKLIEWLLENRPDYRITQENIYSLSVYEEFDENLLFRLLALAQEQGLPKRAPPYRFIWNNSALDNAVDDGRFKLATFLVERLDFAPTDKFRELQNLHKQKPLLEEYSRLFKLCLKGELAAVRHLIEDQSLDPRQQHNGTNLFIQAAASGRLELVQYLYENCGFDVRINERNRFGYTALTEAETGNHQSIVKFLLEHGAHSMVPSTEEIDTSDFLSLIECKLEILKQLDIDYDQREDGELLLHHYIRYIDEPDEATFRFLLSHLDNVDQRTSVGMDVLSGATPLHLALQSGNKLCRKMLLDAGADINAKSHGLRLTSLHFAIMGRAERTLIKQLIEKHEIGVNTRDALGCSIAFYMPPDAELNHWLVDRYNYDPYACDNSGRTVLHDKVKGNRLFVNAEVEYLLNVLQFPQTLTDDTGRLALHYAVQVGNLSTVRLLSKYCRDLCHVPDNKGVTSMKLAQDLNHTSIVEFFRSITPEA